MDATRADALAARSHLAATGWIPRNAESFRHLPPPDVAAWLPPPAGSTGATPTAWVLQGAGAGVQARWLDAGDRAQRSELLEGLPAPGGDGEAAPFAWAHRALVRDGLRLRVGAHPQAAVLRLTRRPHDAVDVPLLVVELMPGARCVLVEDHHAAATVQNLQVHVRLGQGAELRHLRAVGPAAGGTIAHHLQVRVDEGARYEQRLLATGSSYHLQRMLLELAGPCAQAHAAAVLFAAGTALDNQVRTRHAARATRSNVEMLALGSGAARMVGNAHTLIAAGCNGADVRQRLVGVPTAGQPKLVLRPHLEIHHDDVQAAHGATWGALPEDALFLARQRGLDEATAKAMIVEGLARKLLLPDEEGCVELEAALAAAVREHFGAGKEAGHG